MNLDITQLPSATKGHEQFLQFLVHIVRPRVTVELGTDYGFSLFNFAIPGIGDVYGIDDYSNPFHQGKGAEKRHVISANSLPNMRVIDCTFRDMADRWPSSREIDILFIDGGHSFEETEECWNDWSRFVRNDGIVLFHDTESFPDGSGMFFRALARSHPSFNFTHAHGLGMIVK